MPYRSLKRQNRFGCNCGQMWVFHHNCNKCLTHDIMVTKRLKDVWWVRLFKLVWMEELYHGN